MNNFKCNQCQSEFFVAHYIIGNLNGELVYKYRTGKPIDCPNCHAVNINSIIKSGGFTTEIGKYSMRSISERQEHLKSRSHAHFKKEIEEKRRTINGSATLQSLD